MVCGKYGIFSTHPHVGNRASVTDIFSLCFSQINSTIVVEYVRREYLSRASDGKALRAKIYI